VCSTAFVACFAHQVWLTVQDGDYSKSYNVCAATPICNVKIRVSMGLILGLNKGRAPAAAAAAARPAGAVRAAQAHPGRVGKGIEPRSGP